MSLSLAAGVFGCAPATDHETEEDVRVREDAVTVAQAGGCSTSVLEGLSLQIIAESNCLHPGAFAELPDRPNLTKGPAVYAFLEEPARDALVAALDAKPGSTMKVNSMLRTPAQQYLLKRWSRQGRCGIGLAATPGNSKHESGLAIDISQYSTWKFTLSQRGFKWFGSSDKVHFTYTGSGALDHRALGVLAFQRLWNRNHPEDPIGEDGDWGPNTEDRMEMAPVDGFLHGATCEPSWEEAVECPGDEEICADLCDPGPSELDVPDGCPLPQCQCPAAPPVASTCEGNCGGAAPDESCYCDADCEYWDDCCSDYADYCF